MDSEVDRLLIEIARLMPLLQHNPIKKEGNPLLANLWEAGQIMSQIIYTLVFRKSTRCRKELKLICRKVDLPMISLTCQSIISHTMGMYLRWREILRRNLFNLRVNSLQSNINNLPKTKEILWHNLLLRIVPKHLLTQPQKDLIGREVAL